MIGTLLKQQGALLPTPSTQFKEAIKHRPRSAEAHLSLGQALSQQGDKEAGAAALAEADRLNRRTADAQASTFAVGVGVQKAKAGDDRGAIAQFREAIRLADDNPQAHYQLGAGAAAHRRARRSADALRDARIALRRT